MSKLKQVLIVLPICFLFGGLAVLSCLLDPTFVPDLYRVTSMIIVVLWAFFIVPALLFIVKSAIEYFKTKSNEQSFLIGAKIGLLLGGLVILFLLATPVIGIIWLVQSIREAVLSVKQKKQVKSDVPDIFDI